MSIEDSTPPIIDNQSEESTDEQVVTKPKKKFFAPFWAVILLWMFFVGGFGGFILFFYGVAHDTNKWFGGMPSLDDLANPDSELSSKLYSADSVLLGKYYRSNRTNVSFDEISPQVLNALYATEDVRYYEHSGIDLKGSFAILYYLLKNDKRGSSTITQQLAKNLFRTRTKRFKGTWSDISGIGQVINKAKEWIISVRLERTYTKHEIVSMYLNTVDFGSNSFGIDVAAKTFFGKDQLYLEPQEAALLTGLLKAPTTYSPIINPENALLRRNTILNQMTKYNFLTAALCDSLKKQPIELSYLVENHKTGSATYFRTEVKKELMRWCASQGNKYDLFSDGLRIYTTIDSRLQKYAEEAVNVHMTYLQDAFFKHWKGRNPWTHEGAWGNFVETDGFLNRVVYRTDVYRKLKKKNKGNKELAWKELEVKKPMKIFTYHGEKDTLFSSLDSIKYYLHFLHTGFMSMDPHTGEIKAWVGGVNYKYFQYDHVKNGRRQPGSTFKPIVYATILGEASNLFSPCYKAVDAPVTFMTGDPKNPTWTPQNADGVFTGDTMTLRQAMGRSKNSITAYMMRTLGDQTPQMVADYARKLGITSPLEAVPAMCLGTNDVSVYELIGAYSTFANAGVYTEPHFISRIEDELGNVLVDFNKERRTVMSPEQAYTMLVMLMGATQEREGTGLGLYRYDLLRDNQVGAKTGTTQNYSDGWFMGVTQDLVSGAWVGADHRSIHFRSIEYGQGARMAMPIWAEYMQRVYADTTLGITRKRFDIPEGNLESLIDCGYLAKEDSPYHMKYQFVKSDSLSGYDSLDLRHDSTRPKKEVDYFKDVEEFDFNSMTDEDDFHD